MNEAEISAAASTLESLSTKIYAYTTASGYASMEKDYSSWYNSFTATQTSLPTVLPESAQELLENFAQNSIEMLEGKLAVADKKSYMGEDTQKAYVKDVEEFIKVAKSVLEELEDLVLETGAAVRAAGGMGVGAVVMAAGLAVVAAL